VWKYWFLKFEFRKSTLTSDTPKFATNANILSGEITMPLGKDPIGIGTPATGDLLQEDQSE